ncbi:ABC transporter ATP-binding protein [Lentzea tibetensis]|uniref:ABC transporter ATP-binding protein n=1 Tax=Lentzea tibetensis TaxID=2591470 RepID=A0A563EYS0_9PSEU|nr:ABC transporter ATP-binding protein [Lentzea tibetensis]TWP52678.1 ABC transporter ATP-binding protein [Lentzea tibetensis]
MIALAADRVGRRFGRTWALRDCSFEIPDGSVTALVGVNGAGKSTLLTLATGLLAPTEGAVRVLGTAPGSRGIHPRVSFLAQDKPTHRGFTVAEMLRFGRELNPTWDDEYARRLVDEAGVGLDAKIRTLSGGQRTRVALAVALGKRPELLLLDEPIADLDPVARDEVLRMLMAEVADTGTTVVLSSHALSELGNVCDHLLLLGSGRVRLAGDVDELLRSHRVLVHEPAGAHHVVEARGSIRLVRTEDPAAGTAPNLEELVLAYLRTEDAS